jgi:hypothetical protein
MKAAPTKTILVWVSSIMASLFFTGLSHARIDSEAIAGMWLFDEDEDDIAEDSSGNGNTGKLTNGPKWDDGKFGSALEFDGGTTYVSCGNGPSLDITEELTVVAWVKFNAVDYKNGTGDLFTIAAKGNHDRDVPNSGWWFSHDNRDNGQGFNYACFGNKNGGWAGGGNNFSGCNFQFTKGEWYHLAITVGESTAKLYVNGTQLGADKPVANLVLSDASTDLSIGGNTLKGAYYFNGLIDEVAIFNVALEQEDIQDIMDKGLERASGLTAVFPAGKFSVTWGRIKSQY